jgi:PAB1-binding protein PBP1
MNDTVRSLGAITEGRQAAFVPPTAPTMPTVPASVPIPQQAPNQPPPTRFAPAPQQTPKPAAAKRTWVTTVIAVLVAIGVGILVAQLFFV